MALPFEEDRELQEKLLEILGEDAGRYAFVIKDVATGRGAVHNPEQVHYAASLFKLFVMFELFHQQDLGLLDLSDEVLMTPYYDAFGLMALRATQVCQLLPVEDVIAAMMAISDNAAAVLLQDLAGAGNINRSIAALGLKDSGLFPDALPVTATDLALLLEAIARGRAISPSASEEMVHLMLREGIDNGLGAGVPRGVAVAHKTGNWDNATHEAGIVFAPKGPYVFVVLSEAAHETSIIKALSQAAYAHFEKQ